MRVLILALCAVAANARTFSLTMSRVGSPSISRASLLMRPGISGNQRLLPPALADSRLSHKDIEQVIFTQKY